MERVTNGRIREIVEVTRAVVEYIKDEQLIWLVMFAERLLKRIFQQKPGKRDSRDDLERAGRVA